MKNTALLWSGGKDSMMALYEADQDGFSIHCLVTFAPEEPNFLAHPLGFIKLQAQALALPHYVFPIREPFEESYETSLARLRNEIGIDCVVTGDVSEVAGYPNWIRQRCRPVGMNVHTPLWGRDRNTLLQQLLERGIKTLFSCVNTRWLIQSWVGRKLDETSITELQAIRHQTGLDLCGENGEYHTIVIDGPQFNQSINIPSFSIRTSESFAYMQIHEMELVDQAG